MTTRNDWQDFITFMRMESDCKFNEIFYEFNQLMEKESNPLMALMALFTSPFWAILWWFIGPIRAAIRRSSIASNAYDIEDTCSEYKITRNRDGQMGVCYWHNWYNCKQQLYSCYDEVIRFDWEGFVVCKNGKYGIFYAPKNIMVVPCIYDQCKLDEDECNVILNRNGQNTKFNKFGERILN
ncbi:MAG: hypothetical protein NC116_09700 [Clostridium sp.]|nr:hypothetical protein [Clostridium sp.]